MNTEDETTFIFVWILECSQLFQNKSTMKPGVPTRPPDRVLHNLGRASSTERPCNHTVDTQEGAVRFSRCDRDLLGRKVSLKSNLTFRGITTQGKSGRDGSGERTLNKFTKS
jgi:hypothetical protein